MSSLKRSSTGGSPVYRKGALPFFSVVFCLGQFGDVERGVAEPHFRFIYLLLSIYRLLDRRLLKFLIRGLSDLTANSDP
jgi:hypothetical protein